jgi:hypothetical protein
LSKRSPFRELHHGVLVNAGRWSGPALAVVGLLATATIGLLPAAERSTLTWWIFSSALAPERVLPLVGIGAALALVDFRYCLAALVLFGGGITVGFIAHDWLLSALEKIPQATNHHFLIGPISSVAVGVALVLPGARLRSWLLLFAAPVTGSLLAVAIKVTDPNLDDTTIPLVGVVVGIGIVISILLTARAFRREWFLIPACIFGSWLIAIGMLYGGISLVPKHNPPLLSPAAPTPNVMPVPEFDHLRPDLSGSQDGPVPEIPNENPGGFEQP